MNSPFLRVNDLVVQTRGGDRLVDGMSFELDRGEILGLVGESGSGKSMACRAIVQLLPDRSLRISGGSVHLADQELTSLPEAAMRNIRGSEIGMIFQNPASHLDPIMSIGKQIAEAISLHEGATRSDARSAAIELLRQVGIPDPASRVHSFAHEFSGGMRQRAMIALALACNPKLLIADEPTTALDVTVQAQVLRLLLELRDKRGLSILLVTHDLGVVSQTCDSIAVMYAGRLCEYGPKRVLLSTPAHHYTAGLIRCQPSSSGGSGPLDTIAGQPPAVNSTLSGCRFHPRCDAASDFCSEKQPQIAMHDTSHRSACHHPCFSVRAE